MFLPSCFLVERRQLYFERWFRNPFIGYSAFVLKKLYSPSISSLVKIKSESSRDFQFKCVTIHACERTKARTRMWNQLAIQLSQTAI